MTPIKFSQRTCLDVPLIATCLKVMSHECMIFKMPFTGLINFLPHIFFYFKSINITALYHFLRERNAEDITRKELSLIRHHIRFPVKVLAPKGNEERTLGGWRRV